MSRGPTWPRDASSRIFNRRHMRRRFALFFALGTGVSVSAAALIACSSPEPKSKIPFEYRDDDADPKKDAGKKRREDPQTEEDPPLADGGKPPGVGGPGQGSRSDGLRRRVGEPIFRIGRRPGAENRGNRPSLTWTDGR